MKTDCADRAVGLIQATGWLHVLVVKLQWPQKRWKEAGHGGEDLLSLSGLGQVMGNWEAKGLWVSMRLKGICL